MNEFIWEKQPDGSERAVIMIAVGFRRVRNFVHESFTLWRPRDPYDIGNEYDDVTFYLTVDGHWFKAEYVENELGRYRVLNRAHPVDVARDFECSGHKPPEAIDAEDVALAKDHERYRAWRKGPGYPEWWKSLAEVKARDPGPGCAAGAGSTGDGKEGHTCSDPPGKGNPFDWIVGSRRELNRALGKSETYSDYLERLEGKGEIRFEQRGARCFAIRFVSDPKRHEQVKAALAGERGRPESGAPGPGTSNDATKSV